MKRKKIVKSDTSATKKSNVEISEVRTLLDVMRAIKIEETKQKKGKKIKS